MPRRERMRTLCSLTVAAMLAPALGHAGDASSNGVGLRLGSDGVVIGYSHALGSHVDVSAGYAFGRYSGSLTESDIQYDATVRYAAPQAMVDLLPFANGFRIRAGLYGSSPDIRLLAAGTNRNYQVGNNQYTATGEFRGDLDFGAVAPYLGLGWGGSTHGSGFGISIDAGVMFAHPPSVTLTAQGRACDSTLTSCDPSQPIVGFDVNDPNDPRAQTFRDQLATERQNVEDNLSNQRYWPVVNLGAHYRF